MALACPLCCGERFSDVAALRAHVAAAARRLRCPLCTTHFDNLMVMVKHLERGCTGAPAPEKVEQADSQDTNDSLAGLDNTETVFEAADDDSEQDEANNSRIIKTEFSSSKKKYAALKNSETISEDHCTDENGQVYRRRVVKIANLWSELSQDKNEGADSRQETAVVRPSYVPMQKNSNLSWRECSLCSKRFRGDHSYRLHVDVVHHGQVHQCANCDESFANESALRKHAAENHESPYACIYCNRPFASLNLARKHIESHKRRKTNNQYSCELCEETAANPTELKRHYREAHRDVLNPKNVPTMIAPYKLGSLWYEWEGHSYVQRSLSRAGTQSLQCWVDGCWVVVRVPVIGQVTVTGEHMHEPYPWIKERNEMYCALRRRSSSETTPIRIIYDEESFRFPEGAKRVNFPESNMRKWRKESKMSAGEESVVWSNSKEELLSLLPGSIVVNKVTRKRGAEGEE